MATGKHLSYCRKEREIAEIHTKVERIEKVVMDGNGNEPLATCVPKISQELETLNGKTIPALQVGISGFVRFMNEEEGRQEGKAQMRRRTQWVIGTLIFITTSLLGLLITLILKMP